jgi:hypothetical protein
MVSKSKHAKDVVFCTHPERPEAWQRTILESDHVIVMAEQYKQAAIMSGKQGNDVTLIYPGVDDRYLDTQLRVFNPTWMSGTKRPARKGKETWDKLCALPWLNCICSDGKMSPEMVELHMRACDVVVSTAWMEGGPMAIWEAHAIGKPVLVRYGVGAYECAPILNCYLDDDNLIDKLRTSHYSKQQSKYWINKAYTHQDYTQAVWSVFDKVSGKHLTECQSVEPEPVQAVASDRKRRLHRARRAKR